MVIDFSQAYINETNQVFYSTDAHLIFASKENVPVLHINSLRCVKRGIAWEKIGASEETFFIYME